MQTIFMTAYPVLPQRRFLMNPSTHRKNRLTVYANQDENNKFTDKDLVVLKMRIKKMKALESKSDKGPNSQEPEKLFVQDHGDFSEEIELLRSYFTKNRQKVVLGMLALITMSVPLSSSPIMVNALKVVKELLAGCHVCIDIHF